MLSSLLRLFISSAKAAGSPKQVLWVKDGAGNPILDHGENIYVTPLLVDGEIAFYRCDITGDVWIPLPQRSLYPRNERMVFYMVYSMQVDGRRAGSCLRDERNGGDAV